MTALAVIGAELDGTAVGLRCVDGRIAALGPAVKAEPGDQVIDGAGMLLCPPLINGHTHAAMTLFRGFGDDMPLMEWLENWIWPAEAKLEPEDVYWGARLACVEMIRSGTSRFFDMYWHAAETARAAQDSGVRLTATTAVIDAPSSSGRGGLREEWIEVVDRLKEFGPLVTPSLGPHAIYTVGRETLEWMAEVTAKRELAVQVHLSETEQEVHDCVEANGKRPAFYLDEVGLLGPRTALAHGVWLDTDELELVAERGATVVSNPAANMKLAVGRAFPYPEAARAGVPLALGTDGVSSNSNLDLFEEVKLFSLLQKHTTGDPATLPASEALAIARGQRSPLMAGTELAPGQPADFLLLRTSDPELSVGDPDALLVYGATGSIVDTTVVAGRVLMQERRVPDAEEIVAEVRGRAKRLTS